jgi:hypothetical protein
MNCSLIRKALVLGTVALAPLGVAGVAHADDTTNQMGKAPVDDAVNKGYPEPGQVDQPVDQGKDQASETATKDKTAKAGDEGKEETPKAAKKAKHKAPEGTDKAAQEANKTSSLPGIGELEQGIADSL